MIQIAFLYTRLPMYFYKCLEYLVDNDENVIVDIYVQGLDPDSPYTIVPSSDRIRIDEYSKNTHSKVVGIKPSIVYCAGWGDRTYMKLVKELRSNGAATICGLDNPWTGGFKQRIKTLLFSGYIKQHFDYIWTAGSSQKVFAKKMGFTDHKILSDLYVGIISEYNVAENELEVKVMNYPKKLVYFGRLVPYKQVVMLAETFASLIATERNGWKLEIVGRGIDKEKLTDLSSENILLSDFMQPTELAAYIKSKGAYVLPSTLEHWGVAVHEAALAGLPIIASDGVKAAEVFLEHNRNGFSFQATSRDELKKSLTSLFSMTDLDLLTFAKHSVKLSQRITYKSWRDNLLKVLN